MIVIMQPDATEDQVARVDQALTTLGFRVHRSDGEVHTVLGAVGIPSTYVDPRDLESLPGVQEVKRISRPFKVADRGLSRKVKQPLFNKTVVVGVGLIGGSMSMSLRESGAVEHVAGVDEREALDSVDAAGVVDEVFSIESLKHALADAELVILAAPVGAIIDTLGRIGNLLPADRDVLVTDVGSTKTAICRAARALPSGVHFVGGHPMAGSERRGPAAADPLLFQDAAWALCPGRDIPEDLLARLRRAIQSVGAHPLLLDPARHDRLAAAVSHVPRLVAAALSNSVGRLGQEDALAPRLAAGGFRDVTRTAESPYEVWRDILATNRGPIVDRLAAFRSALDRIEKALKETEPHPLAAELEEAARHRLNVPRDIPGIHRPETELIVRVLDEVGALANVTTALACEDINIRDIQVLKVRQDEDGVLRLAFADTSETGRAAETLRRAGHHVRMRTDAR